MLQVCEGRLSGGGLEGGVSEHYRAVIRALVAEAIDLASFLQRIAQGKKFPTQASDLLSSEHDLRELQCEDWVSFPARQRRFTMVHYAVRCPQTV